MSPRNEPNRTKAFQTLVRTTAEDKAAMHALADYYGISMSDLVTLLIRKELKREGVKVRPLEHYT
jgi:hypothetical protein